MGFQRGELIRDRDLIERGFIRGGAHYKERQNREGGLVERGA